MSLENHQQTTNMEQPAPLIHELKTLRKSASKMLEAKCKKENKKKLEILDEFEYEVKSPELSHFSLEAEDYSSTDIVMLKNKIKKTIKLIEILSHKADCPISKVVDKI